jgi:membrane protease YdiL (CAAX protease family)
MSAIVTWTRRHRLVAFFGLTFLLSWWSWPFYAVDLAPTAFFPCGPLVAALIVIGITEGRAGYRDLGARMIRWRVGWTWWLVAVGTPLAVLAVAAAANVAIWGAPAPVLATMAWSQLALGAAVRFVNPLDGPLGEEPGWRGYALPRLLVGHGALPAGLGLGVGWALWHLPLFWTAGAALAGRSVLLEVLALRALSVLYTWVFQHTRGSSLLAVLFHAAGNLWGVVALPPADADATPALLRIGALWLLVLGVTAATGPRRLTRGPVAPRADPTVTEGAPGR